MATDTKKLALLRILEILRRDTDADHPLTHGEIVDLLLAEHGIEIERKAVGRNIALLVDAGYDVVTTRRGVYLNTRTYTPAETRLLIDSVLAGRHADAELAQSLIARLSKDQNKYFAPAIRHVVPLADPADPEVAARVSELIDRVSEAIDGGRMVEYDYNRYGADGDLRKTSLQRVTPYRILLHNHRYYLLGYNKYWKSTVYHRLDRITNLSVSARSGATDAEMQGLADTLQASALTTSMPYLYTDAPAEIRLLAHERAVDRIIDRFGRGVQIERVGDAGMLRITFAASPKAMIPWLMQNADEVEVIHPAALRDKIKDSLRKAAARYGE